jgi:hypothetical protein
MRFFCCGLFQKSLEKMQAKTSLATSAVAVEPSLLPTWRRVQAAQYITVPHEPFVVACKDRGNRKLVRLQHGITARTSHSIENRLA